MYPNDLWVTSPTENYLYRIDEGTHNITKVSITGTEPRGVYVSQDKISVYVTNKSSNTLSIFRSGIRINDIEVGKQPWAVCEDIDGNIYVANYMSNTVTKIDGTTGYVLATISVDNGPRGIISDGNGDIYVSCFLTNTVCKIVNDKLVASIEVGLNPEGITCDYNNNIWVACYGSNIVSKIYRNQKILDVSVGAGPIAIVCNKDGAVYVANYLDKTVSVLEKQQAIDDDTNISYTTIGVTNIDVGDNPNSLSVDYNDNIYCTNGSSNTITIISEKKVIKTIDSICPSPTAYGDGTGGVIYNITRTRSGGGEGGLTGPISYDDLDDYLKSLLDKIRNNTIETSADRVSYDDETLTNVDLALDFIIGKVKELENKQYEEDEKIEEIQKELVAIKKKINEIEGIIQQIQEQVDSNTEQIDLINKKLLEIDTTIEEINQSISNLSTKLDNHISESNDKFNSLEGTINEVSTKLNNHISESNDKFNSLEDTINGVSTKLDQYIDSNDETVSTIQSDISNIKTNIGELIDKDSELEDSIIQTNSKIDDYIKLKDEEIKLIKEEQDDLKDSIDSNREQINQNTQNIQQNTSNISQINNSVIGINSSIGNLNQQMIDLNDTMVSVLDKLEELISSGGSSGGGGESKPPEGWDKDDLSIEIQELLNKIINKTVETTAELVSYDNEEFSNVKLALDSIFGSLQEINSKLENINNSELNTIKEQIQSIISSIESIESSYIKDIEYEEATSTLKVYQSDGNIKNLDISTSNQTVYQSIASVPIGFEKFTINPNITEGWLPMLGGEYKRTEYPELWEWVQNQTGYMILESEWIIKANLNANNVPFYSNGDGQSTFRIPSLQCWTRGLRKDEQIGTYLQENLPNIAGRVGSWCWYNAEGSGPFWISSKANNQGGGSGSAQGSSIINFDASRSSSVYNSDTKEVIPRSIIGCWLVRASSSIEFDNNGKLISKTYVPKIDVGNEANKIPRYTEEGHLLLPSGIEIW